MDAIKLWLSNSVSNFLPLLKKCHLHAYHNFNVDRAIKMASCPKRCIHIGNNECNGTAHGYAINMKVVLAIVYEVIRV